MHIHLLAYTYSMDGGYVVSFAMSMCGVEMSLLSKHMYTDKHADVTCDTCLFAYMAYESEDGLTGL